VSAVQRAPRRPRTFDALLLGGIGVVLCVTAPSTAHARKQKVAEPEFTASYSQPAPAQPMPANGSIFQASSGYAALYEGNRARRVGDTLTILLVEQTAASKEAKSVLDKSGDFGITPPTTGPLDFLKSTDLSIGGGHKFSGKGSADQSNSLSGAVSVTVAEVYPNQTMLVRGQKQVRLNRGDEFIQIKGIVRFADIDQNNAVPSTRVADATINYTGTGDVARASRQGWLSRFFQVVSPF
jgi:flagellar L-ring protein precursor FlgH